MKRFSFVPALILLPLLSCGEGDTARPGTSLVAHDAWVLSDPNTDPFVEFREERIPCDPTSVAREDIAGFDSVEVKTGPCSYITLEQAMRSDLREGDQVEIRVWHYFLDELYASEAHVVLQTGDTVLWAEKISLPTDGGIVKGIVTATEDVSADAPLYFHIRNHGRNSWHLLEVNRL